MEDSVKENLRDNTIMPYSVGHFTGSNWGQEGSFDWQEVPINAKVNYGSTMGKSGHGSPFFILRNNIYGGYFVCHLACPLTGSRHSSPIKPTALGCGSQLRQLLPPR